MIKIGDKLPTSTLMEYSEIEGEGCSIGPNAVDTAKASAGKTIALFALPGAFTPTCSAKHVPGYVADGSAAFTQATGLTLDLTARGMGLRSDRYSMLIKDGVVTTINREAPGKFEVSDAATMLAQAKG
jgi:glutaredoxin/glutathione-dependent peroxiredoxin